jgi:hypothetical protein
VKQFLVGREPRFPFHTSSAKKLNVTSPPIVTVVGKAFFDVGHSLKDQKLNRRSHLPGYAAWEIHPVMKMGCSNEVLGNNRRQPQQSRLELGLHFLNSNRRFALAANVLDKLSGFFKTVRR